MNSIIKSFFLTTITVLVMLLSNSIPMGWYLLPMLIGGVLSLTKIISIFKTTYYIRNIFFYVWIVFFISAFIAPLIHFSRDYWLPNYVQFSPSNWNILALKMSTILLYGMGIFIFLEQIKYKPLYQTKKWQFKNNAKSFVIFFMILSFMLQSIYYIKNGGIYGVIRSYTERDNSMEGMGLIFIFSEMFPYLLLLFYFILRRGKKTSLLNVLVFLSVMFLSALYFGGFRGSRSNTVLTIFQAVLLIHFTIYRFNRIHFSAMIAAFFIFMIIGRIYKNEGINFINNPTQYEEYQISQKMSGVESIIIGDLSRYKDVCYEIYMLENNPYYELKLGSTYLSSILTFTPLGIPIRDYLQLTSRTQAASQLMFDYDGKKRSSFQKNTRIFGFVGEAMFNFGFLSFSLSFFFLYFLLTACKRWGDSISIQDARFYFIPLFPLIAINLINADSNNLIFFIVKRIVLMYVIIWFITNKNNDSCIYH